MQPLTQDQGYVLLARKHVDKLDLDVLRAGHRSADVGDRCIPASSLACERRAPRNVKHDILGVVPERSLSIASLHRIQVQPHDVERSHGSIEEATATAASSAN
ncbi:MAG TPA: hypothetical protein VEK09_06845 [Jatrophihabitantaceae bacterium]|nr:hypothetical protein [Jatrophihabitantaceae bacterium]